MSTAINKMFFNLRKKGFTLIELLLGLTLFSIVALSLYGTFSSGIKINKRFKKTGAIYRESMWSFQQFTKDIENMVPYDFSNSYADKVAFSGNKSELKLLLETGKGLNVIEYKLQKPELGNIHKIIVESEATRKSSITTRYEEETNTQHLVRSATAFVDFLLEKGAPDEEILSTKVLEGTLEFSYADWDPEDDKKIIWKEKWTEARFPVGVKIRMTFTDEDTKGSLTLERDVFVPRSFKARFET